MNDIRLPEVVAVGIYNAQIAQKGRERTKNRKTTMFEIELPFEKGGISNIDTESMPINTNMIICAKPGQIRFTRLPYKCYYIHIIVHGGQLYDMLMNMPNYMKMNDTSHYRRIFMRLCKFYDTALDSDKLMLQSNILELIYTLYRSHEHTKRNLNKKSNNELVIDKVIQYIKNNLSADLSLNTLADYVSFSPIHFHNCFKASTGKTLHEYVEEKRIQKAINLLTSTDLTLSKIAYECGFSSQSYFSYAFKKRMNITPRQYAKAMYSRYDSQ